MHNLLFIVTYAEFKKESKDEQRGKALFNKDE
jgi:hypothetical protein